MKLWKNQVMSERNLFDEFHSDPNVDGIRFEPWEPGRETGIKLRPNVISIVTE